MVITWSAPATVMRLAMSLRGRKTRVRALTRVRRGRKEDKLGSDGRSGLVLLVLSSVGVARDDGGDPSSGGGLAGRDEDEKLHEMVVHLQSIERTSSLSALELKKPLGVATREKEGRTSLTRLELSSPSFLLRGHPSRFLSLMERKFCDSPREATGSE